MYETDMNNTSREQMEVADAQKPRGDVWSGEHRRASVERRSDSRVAGDRKWTLIQRVKMYINPRLGVDRRKNVGKETTRVESILTAEEIEALIE